MRNMLNNFHVYTKKTSFYTVCKFYNKTYQSRFRNSFFSEKHFYDNTLRYRHRDIHGNGILSSGKSSILRFTGSISTPAIWIFSAASETSVFCIYDCFSRLFRNDFTIIMQTLSLVLAIQQTLIVTIMQRYIILLVEHVRMQASHLNLVIDRFQCNCECVLWL